MSKPEANYSLKETFGLILPCNCSICRKIVLTRTACSGQKPVWNWEVGKTHRSWKQLNSQPINHCKNTRKQLLIYSSQPIAHKNFEVLLVYSTGLFFIQLLLWLWKHLKGNIVYWLILSVRKKITLEQNMEEVLDISLVESTSGTLQIFLLHCLHCELSAFVYESFKGSIQTSQNVQPLFHFQICCGRNCASSPILFSLARGNCAPQWLELIKPKANFENTQHDKEYRMSYRETTQTTLLVWASFRQEIVLKQTTSIRQSAHMFLKGTPVCMPSFVAVVCWFGSTKVKKSYQLQHGFSYAGGREWVTIWSTQPVVIVSLFMWFEHLVKADENHWEHVFVSIFQLFLSWITPVLCSLQGFSESNFLDYHLEYSDID